MKLKVCGMRSSKNIINLSKIIPDYMGFIFWEKSKRHVKGSTPNLSETKIKKTGVFVNAGFENISIIEIAKLVARKIDSEILVTESNDPRSYRQDSSKLINSPLKKYAKYLSLKLTSKSPKPK